MTTLLYLLFFISGLSGLIYQVIWVRTFGNVFGNTIYSAAIVVAIFMLGLGAGSYIVGAWADRRYARQPDSLLRAYGYVEIVIAGLGLGISALLPQLDQVSALVSSYVRDPQGWFVLSTGSYLARAGIAVALLTPITLLMGGTLTLLVRHLVRRDVEAGGWRIAVLYAINTAGAAAGALLTDFALVPSYGLRNTQFIAVAFNVVAGVGALILAFRLEPEATSTRPEATTARLEATTARLEATRDREASSRRKPRSKQHSPVVQQQSRITSHESRLVWGTAAAIALSGVAAMGMEILWFRHFTIVLGQFRAVFSLLLAVILAGIGAGALVAGAVARRTARPAAWFMFAQALFVAVTLLGLSLADAALTDAAIQSDPSFQSGIAVGSAGTYAELWFNAKPMLVEVAIPALLMGFSFPLANAMLQRAEHAVGRRAGVLYFANTAGAVAGSLITGFVLLPTLGIQGSAAVLMAAAAAAIVPL